MKVTVKIGTTAVSYLDNITTVHWFPWPVGELTLYCENGSWTGREVSLRALHVMPDGGTIWTSSNGRMEKPVMDEDREYCEHGYAISTYCPDCDQIEADRDE